MSLADDLERIDLVQAGLLGGPGVVPPLRWTRDAPMETGRYWYRRGGPYEDDICLVTKGKDGLRCYYEHMNLLMYERDWPDFWLWAGPIPHPEDE